MTSYSHQIIFSVTWERALWINNNNNNDDNNYSMFDFKKIYFKIEKRNKEKKSVLELGEVKSSQCIQRFHLSGFKQMPIKNIQKEKKNPEFKKKWAKFEYASHRGLHWLVVLFYGLSPLFGSFNAKLSYFEKKVSNDSV